MKKVGVWSVQALMAVGIAAYLGKDTRLTVYEDRGISLKKFAGSGKDQDFSIYVLDSPGMSDGDFQWMMGAREFASDLMKVIVLADADQVERYKELGADAVFDRNAPDTPELLAHAISQFGAHDLTQLMKRGRGRPRMVTGGFELSPREYEVATLIAQGFTNQQIAEAMSLKEQSVKNLVSTVIRKLHCENRVQVALRFTNRSPEPGKDRKEA